MKTFTTTLCLPAQAAAETEATIVKWLVKPGSAFKKSAILAEAESAKSTFQFDAPCDGIVKQILVPESATVPFDTPVIEIETSDETIRSMTSAPAAVSKAEEPTPQSGPTPKVIMSHDDRVVSILGVGGYLPDRVVTTKELLGEFPDVTEEYMFGVTGIRERRWAGANEKPSDMAFAAARDAIAKSGLKPSDIDAIILSTTTPDFCMPSTSCILQGMLGIPGIPCFDINAACSGWLYALSIARGLILSGIGTTILVVAVDMQSRLLDKTDKNTYFLFGDGAGAAVVTDGGEGHRICKEILYADAAGLRMARREFPGYEVPANTTADPWMRLDGKALFRNATESFSTFIHQVIEKSGWQANDVRWIVPHQANGRIIKAAAEKSGVPFDRFYLNLEHVGNTSSASIPLALLEIERFLHKGDKLVFCTVGAGITSAAMSIEW